MWFKEKEEIHYCKKCGYAFDNYRHNNTCYGWSCGYCKVCLQKVLEEQQENIMISLYVENHREAILKKARVYHEMLHKSRTTEATEVTQWL